MYPIASLGHIWDLCLGTVTEEDDDGNIISSINPDIQEPSDPYLCPTINEIDLEAWGVKLVTTPTKDYTDSSYPDGNLIRKQDLTVISYDSDNEQVFKTAGEYTMTCKLGDVGATLSRLWSLNVAWYLGGYVTIFEQSTLTNNYISHGSPVGSYDDLAVSNYQYNFYDGTVFYGVGVTDQSFSTDGTWNVKATGSLHVNIADDFSVVDDGQRGYSCIDIATLSSKISSTMYLYIYGHVECYYGAQSIPKYTATKCLYGVRINTEGTWKVIQTHSALNFPEFIRQNSVYSAISKVESWLYFSIG